MCNRPVSAQHLYVDGDSVIWTNYFFNDIGLIKHDEHVIESFTRWEGSHCFLGSLFA
jgi:hypothetical protein